MKRLLFAAVAGFAVPAALSVGAPGVAETTAPRLLRAEAVLRQKPAPATPL